MSVLILILDQGSKYLVENLAPAGSIIASYFDGLARLVHIRNPDLAFSLAAGSDPLSRSLLYFILPLILLVLAISYLLFSPKASKGRRWVLGALIGGASGNLFDRFFRPNGTIDFIDIKFFGILGYERWPAFNLADAALVTGGIMLAATILFQRSHRS